MYEALRTAASTATVTHGRRAGCARTATAGCGIGIPVHNSCLPRYINLSSGRGRPWRRPLRPPALTCRAVRWRRYRSQSGAATLPPVTVLKPLCGAERHLYDCLRSFCDQAYPGFQIVFGVRDPEDPALIIVRRLQREFQGLDLHIASNPAQHGSNGKVSNLVNMMPPARYAHLVVRDSDLT